MPLLHRQDMYLGALMLEACSPIDLCSLHIQNHNACNVTGGARHCASSPCAHLLGRKVRMDTAAIGELALPLAAAGHAASRRDQVKSTTHMLAVLSVQGRHHFSRVACKELGIRIRWREWPSPVWPVIPATVPMYPERGEHLGPDLLRDLEEAPLKADARERCHHRAGNASIRARPPERDRLFVQAGS